MPEPIATLTKNGQTRQAFTPADLVSLKFDGWRVATAAPVQPAPVQTNPLDLDPEPVTEPEAQQ